MSWTNEEVATRVASDLQPGACVNLGIGLPTLVSRFVPATRGVMFHSENGIIGMGPPPDHDDARDPDLVDAGKAPVTLVPGAAIVDHEVSFCVIRGGRLDVAVLGAFQVSERGDLANWKRAQVALGSVGGAMDIAVGAKRTVVMMRHVDADGQAKILRRCTFPLTAPACVRRIYTDLAILDVEQDGLVVREIAPGITRSELQDQTDVRLRWTAA